MERKTKKKKPQDRKKKENENGDKNQRLRNIERRKIETITKDKERKIK
jgi:hypothetical protein